MGRTRLKHRVDGPWPTRLSVVFKPEQPTATCYTERFRGLPTTVDVVLGIQQGMRVPTLAHEGLHAALWVTADGKWQDWAPHWVGIRAQKEETIAFIIEQVVRTGLMMADKYSIPLDNSYRHVSTWTYVAGKELI